MSRAIVLSLRRKLKHEQVERLRHADPALFARLAAQLARWAQDNGPAIGAARPALPDALDDRAQDNWEPLLAIADRAGGHWGDTARKAALALSGAPKDDDGSIGTQLLAALRDAFEAKGTPAHLPSAAFLEYLCDDETAPWATYNRGKEIRASQVAKRLREYGITPRNKKQSGAVKKGYFFADCEDAFGRYLYTPHQGEDTAATAATPQENPYETDAYTVANAQSVRASKAPAATQKPFQNNSVAAVAAAQGYGGQRDKVGVTL